MDRVGSRRQIGVHGRFKTVILASDEFGGVGIDSIARPHHVCILRHSVSIRPSIGLIDAGSDTDVVLVDDTLRAF